MGEAFKAGETAKAASVTTFTRRARRSDRGRSYGRSYPEGRCDRALAHGDTKLPRVHEAEELRRAALVFGKVTAIA